MCGLNDLIGCHFCILLEACSVVRTLPHVCPGLPSIDSWGGTARRQSIELIIIFVGVHVHCAHARRISCADASLKSPIRHHSCGSNAGMVAARL